MSQARMTLDNPVFAGTLRYTRRSVSYKSRALQPRTIQDVVAVRQAAPKHLAAMQDVRPSRPAPEARQRHVKVSIQQPRPVAQRLRTTQKRRKRKTSLHSLNPKTATLYVAALILFGFGLYVGINGMTANKKVAAQVKVLQATNSNPDASSASTASTAPPSSEKVSATTVRNYVVAPANPRYIDIPKLNIHARVLSMTVNRSNELQAPYGIYDAGWYTGSALPGQNGAMLVDGHSGIGKTHGIFHDLPKLAVGDSIAITRGDGQKFTYKVVKVAIVDSAKVDMGSLLVSQDTSKPGLNLITCAGDWIPGTFSLKQRALVYAVMQ